MAEDKPTTQPVVTRTEAQRKALEGYNEACRELAACAHALNEAQQAYNRALASYHENYGAARALGVV